MRYLLKPGICNIISVSSSKYFNKNGFAAFNSFSIEMRCLIHIIFVFALLPFTKDSNKKFVQKKFEIRFKNIHANFYDELMRDFPTLTLDERRLCAFLKLQMTTKEIASLTGQSIRAVELARTRLRKKLQLTNSEINLYDFILNYGN
jgi:hypothetical protein